MSTDTASTREAQLAGMANELLDAGYIVLDVLDPATETAAEALQRARYLTRLAAEATWAVSATTPVGSLSGIDAATTFAGRAYAALRGWTLRIGDKTTTHIGGKSVMSAVNAFAELVGSEDRYATVDFLQATEDDPWRVEIGGAAVSAWVSAE